MRIGAESRYCTRLCAPDGVDCGVRLVPCLLAFCLLMLGCGVTAAQTPGPEAPPSAPANPPPPPAEPQGVLDAFGNWVQQGVANVGAGFGAMVGVVGGQAGQAAKGAADVARDAATSVAKLPVSSVINGRER